MRNSCLAVGSLALSAILGCGGPREILAARYAPKPEWTPANYAVSTHASSAANARLSEEEMVEDIAFLEHMLEQAYEQQFGIEAEKNRAIRRAIPLDRQTRAEFCVRLAKEYGAKPIELDLGTLHCSGNPPNAMPIIPPAGQTPDRNYFWRVESTPTESIGVLTISRFVDPADPGWAGFGDVLEKLAASELVLLDLQHASGNDPRMGFAVLTALGIKDFEKNPPMRVTSHDNAFADAARANFKKRNSDTQPRSRALWSQFETAQQIIKFGTALAPARALELAKATVVVEDGCESGCQMLMSLLRFQPRVEILTANGTSERLNGDEMGTIHLPNSGIDVTFPTATYGTAYGGRLRMGSMGRGSSLIPSELANLHLLGQHIATRRKWATAPVPDCMTLPNDAKALNKKVGGCFGLSQHGSSIERVQVRLTLGDARARTFLASCGFEIFTITEGPLDSDTLASVQAPIEVLQRAASAEFVDRIEWGCPVYPNATH